MAYSNKQLARYNRIRRFMNTKWPNAFTNVNSGLPKKPLMVGIKQAILEIHPEYTEDDAGMPRLRGIGAINQYAIPERGPNFRQWRMNHGWQNGREQTSSFEEDLTLFLRIYCTGLRYWLACSRVGSPRFNIDGERIPFQIVSNVHANYATERLNEALANGANRDRYLSLVRQGQ